jgi:putative phosphoribosyl transferase
LFIGDDHASDRHRSCLPKSFSPQMEHGSWVVDMTGSIFEDRMLRGRRSVFRDRKEAGKALSRLLESYKDKDVTVLAIPSGGLPVAAEVAQALCAPLDIVIVRKLQIPRNPEAGFGAISMNGDIILNQELVAELGLTEEQIHRAKENALKEGRAREKALRGSGAPPNLTGSIAIVVDDGLASGYTMLAAIRAVRAGHPSKLIVAVPTGSERSVKVVAEEADEVVCLNVRGMPFAVADAYRTWYDVDEAEAVWVLRSGNRP